MRSVTIDADVLLLLLLLLLLNKVLVLKDVCLWLLLKLTFTLTGADIERFDVEFEFERGAMPVVVVDEPLESSSNFFIIDFGVNGIAGCCWLLMFSNFFFMSLNDEQALTVSGWHDATTSVQVVLGTEEAPPLSLVFKFFFDSRLIIMRLAALIISVVDILLAFGVVAIVLVDFVGLKGLLFSLLLLLLGEGILVVIDLLLLFVKLIIWNLGEQ